MSFKEHIRDRRKGEGNSMSIIIFSQEDSSFMITYHIFLLLFSNILFLFFKIGSLYITLVFLELTTLAGSASNSQHYQTFFLKAKCETKIYCHLKTAHVVQICTNTVVIMNISPMFPITFIDIKKNTHLLFLVVL